MNTSVSPKVQYAYASGNTNTVRPTSVTYPSGRVVSYDYGTANGINDAISRVEAVKDGATALAQYNCLGQPTFVITDYTEPDIKWTLADLAGSNDPDTGDIYSGFDRFGRVKDNRWYNYGTSSDTDRIQYGYDRNGNRTYRENTVATANSAKFDEQYLYDLLDRLKHMDRGQLTALKDSITNKTFAQCWSLDPTGNWKKFLEDDNGDGTWSLNQTRTANKVNEISDISESTGPSWITPAYNRAGNMTTMPKVADPTVSQTCTYDAWNRLTKVAEGATSISEYTYDGAKRRILQKSYTSGTLSETRHLYYTEPSKWQVIEERLGTSPDSANAERQFVWGLRYIDDLILRDRDTDNNGTLNERLYAMQDANWNVTAITNASGTVQERYNYAAYGMPTFLTSSFGSRSSSSFDWETLYCGYRWERGNGLFHVRNRVFNQRFGTWLQRDPLRQFNGANLYWYCNSSPLKYSDAFGRDVWDGIIGGMDFLADAATCACGIASVLDIASNNTFVEAFDCLCNMMSTIGLLNDWLEGRRGACGFLAYGALTIADCSGALVAPIILGLIGAVAGAAFGPFAILWGFAGVAIGVTEIGIAIVDLLFTGLQNIISSGSPLPVSQAQACARVGGSVAGLLP